MDSVKDHLLYFKGGGRGRIHTHLAKQASAATRKCIDLYCEQHHYHAEIVQRGPVTKAEDDCYMFTHSKTFAIEVPAQTTFIYVVPKEAGQLSLTSDFFFP